jgi:hypothetical protein
MYGDEIDAVDQQVERFGCTSKCSIRSMWHELTEALELRKLVEQPEPVRPRLRWPPIRLAFRRSLTHIHSAILDEWRPALYPDFLLDN